MRAARFAAVAFFFSVAANAVGTFTVTNINDSGAGSLRQAILDANAASGGTVAFNLSPAPAKIMLQSALPTIGASTVVNGMTQPGYAGKPLVEIDGSLLPANTQAVNVSGTLKGVAVGNCTYRAVSVFDGGVLSDSFIGLDSSGMAARPNGSGVTCWKGTVLNNVVSGNVYGIMIGFGGPSLVSGNVVGLNAAQTSAIPNMNGVEVEYTSDITISGNTVAGNSQDGIDLFYTNNSFVTGNRIGLNGAGVSFPNGTGIEVYQSSGNTIGGSGGAGNFIANSHNYGIAMSATSVRNPISRNSIYNSGQLGIELYNYPPDGPTPNDPGDADTGPNLMQNYPVLTHVTGTGGATITGSLSSTPSTAYTLEFFANPTCHSSGYGEGKSYLGSANVATDGAGNASFSVNFPSAVVSSGMAVTATATDPFGNTSEFSHCALVEGPGLFAWSSTTSQITEANTSVTLTVLRMSGSIGSVTVDYATVNGTATAGSDYTAKSGTLVFADGETSKSISIPILDDTVYEGSESFTVTLTNATGGAAISQVAGVTTVTILDNDPPPVISGADIRVTEGNSGLTPAVFTLTLSSPSPAPATVQWYTSSGSAYSYSDFQYASGTVTFNPGETQKTVTVQVIGDTVWEQDEYFYLYLYSPSGATLSRYAINCTIVNDDVQPTITADDVRVLEGNSGTTAAVITLKANQPIYGYIQYYTVDDSAKAGKDYTSAYSSVYFSNETQKQITIPIIGDTDVEPDKQFKVHLSNYYYYSYSLARTDVVVTIVNDDIGVGPATQNVAKGSNGQVMIDVGNVVTSPQTLTVAASDPCIKAPASATIGAGAHTTSFIVAALSAPCTAHVDVTMPAALGGKLSAVGIRTYLPLALSFDPASPKVYVGQTLTVHVTAPVDAPVVIPLEDVGATAEVPASVIVGPGGASFTVKGLKAGPLVINVTMPSQNGGGTSQLYGDVLDAPTTVTIAQLSPVTGPIAGGTSVTIAGANFRGDCTFLFGGLPATNVVFGSAASMTATTPAHAAGTVEVTAACGADSFTLANAFTYAGGTPTLTGVTPSFGSTKGGTTVSIAGRDFAPDCWAFFDGLGARSVSVASATQMIATTPAHAEGSVAASVRCRGAAEASLAAAFNYSTAEDPSPVVTSVNPLAGAPGQLVTISGSRFRISDSVAFDSTNAPLLGTTPDAHLVAVPALPLGKVSINVTDANGHVSTTGPIFTVLEPPPPQVTKVSPASVPAGGELAIDGSGFRAPYSFALGDAAARTVTMSYSHAVVRVPATLAPGTYELHVVNGSGQTAALGGNVTVTAGGVVVTGAAPLCAASDGGSAVTISGSGFAAGATVTIGGVAATNVSVADAAHITATLPALTPGWQTITVTNPADGSGTATNALRVYSPYDPDGCGISPRPRPVHH